MTAAAYVLAINLFVAGIFAIAFGSVAAFQRSSRGAVWLAFSYCLGMVTAVMEFILPYQTDHRPVSLIIAMSFVLALAGCCIGLARHYRQQPPWRLLLVLTGASLIGYLLILDMPRTDLVRGLAYQAPYSVMLLVGAAIILRHRGNGALDYALLTLFIAAGLHFLAKPFIAAVLGSGASPQLYLASSYAAISQTTGAVMLISNGIVLLLIIVRDVMADITARSETDTLSGLLNRRGFEDRADKALSLSLRSGVPAVMVVADLDHFKQINDSFGHAAGDAVITAVGRVLKQMASEHSVIGRMGGEEFAVFIPGANLVAGRLYAETVRSVFSRVALEEHGIDRPVSASFGVSQFRASDRLPDLMRRTDAALYEAKSNGRDRVCIAETETRPSLVAIAIAPREDKGPV